MIKKRRGISPVVATVLLVLLAVILAIIIFLWARSILAEKVQKDLGKGPMQIADACKEVGFKADVTLTASSIIAVVDIENIGNVPLYGIELIKVSKGSKTRVGSASFAPNIQAIKSGKSYSFNNVAVSGLEKDDEVIVLPVLLGTNKDAKKQYTCEEDYGIPAVVK